MAHKTKKPIIPDIIFLNFKNGVQVPAYLTPRKTQTMKKQNLPPLEITSAFSPIKQSKIDQIADKIADIFKSHSSSF